MSSVLRVYDPADCLCGCGGECDEHGFPLDWECCRTCVGTGRETAINIDVPLGDNDSPIAPRPGIHSTPSACPTCDGYGSLKAAALAAVHAHKRRGAKYDHEPHCPCLTQDGDCDCERVLRPIRCESCAHPMSEGTWEGEDHGDAFKADLLSQRDNGGRRVAERHGIIYYSPCDEKCKHGAPGRFRQMSGSWEALLDANTSPADLAQYPDTYCVEASWRPVDVRTLGWPHDLRPEKLAVLCLRCLATMGNSSR